MFSESFPVDRKFRRDSVVVAVVETICGLGVVVLVVGVVLVVVDGIDKTNVNWLQINTADKKTVANLLNTFVEAIITLSTGFLI